MSWEDIYLLINRIFKCRVNFNAQLSNFNQENVITYLSISQLSEILGFQLQIGFCEDTQTMSKEILELVKLFTVQYLQQVEGFQGFSRESVVIISNYILALLSHMARSVKELVGEVQNRKLPNCLHLLFVCSEIRNIIHITPFATYLHRKNKKGNKKQLNIHLRNLFSEKLKWGEKQETCYHNIKKVPEQYMIGEEMEKTYNKVYWPETVPLFAAVEEWVQKPHPFTYTNQSQLIRNKVNSEMPDQSKRAQEEHIRRSLSSFPRSQAKQTTFEPPRKCFSLRKNPYKISDFI